MKTKNRNFYLDLFKIILAFFVVGIHFSPSPLFRIAVPFFFMTSGYFCFKEDKEKNLTSSKKLLSSSIMYLLIGLFVALLYFGAKVIIRQRAGTVTENIIDYNFAEFISHIVKSFTFSNIFVTNNILSMFPQFWFLPAFFTVALIHFCVTKLKLEKLYYYLIPILLATLLFFSTYADLLGVGQIELTYYRNALFLGLPFFALGYLMNKHKKPIEKIWVKYLILAVAILSFGLQIVENKILGLGDIDIYITSIISCVCFLLFFTAISSPNVKWFYKIFGNKTYFIVYIFHMLIGWLIYTRFSPLVTTIISFILSIIINELYVLAVYLFNKIKNKKIKTNDNNDTDNGSILEENSNSDKQNT